MSDIIITPASGKIDFYQDLGAASLAKIELTATNDLALSSISGNLIIGDASRDIYIGNGINDVDIIFEQNGEIRPLPAKTLNIGTSGSFTQILASKVNINQNSFTSIPLDVYSSTSGATILNVAGTKGALFSVTDNLSGSLMSVNNDAGLPVFEVFSDDRVVAGRFGQNDFIMTSGGNVGIGTGVPSSKFHVVGSVLFSSGLSVSGLITSNSGNFINSLTVNSTGVSISGHTHTSSDISNFNSSVSGVVSGIYAPLSSPALIGIPTVPTASSGTNTTQIASTAFVRTEISNLVASAPTTLDTLNELATALGNDANFSTTVTTSLGGKASLSGAVFTGSISGPSGNFTSLKVNSVDVSAVGHTHTASNITDFNSSVSGLLPSNIATGSGVINHVAYWNSSSGIVADSGGLVWNAVDNRLGIGTTSPFSILDISQNNATLRIGDASSNSSVGPRIQFDSIFGSNTGIAYLGFSFFNNKTYLQHGRANVGGIELRSANETPRLYIQDSNGNVGIGTTTPVAQLHVVGTGNFTSDLTVGGNLTVNGTTITANVDSMQIEDPILTLGLASGNIVTTDTLDRGLALVRTTGLIAFMGWDSSASQFVLLSSGVATNSSGNYDAGTYGNLQINNLVANSGNFTNSLTLNGTGVSLVGHTHTASSITDFNEAVDDRIGSGLFVAGTGINLNYNDAANSFTVSVSGLVNNPSNNRLLTSRDSTTTGIDAESNATFDGTTLAVSGAISVDNLRLDGNTLSSASGNIIINPSGTGALQRDSGGNARGQYAVDWQTVRNTGTMVANGDYSVIGGGNNNTSSSISSTVGGGRGNTSSGSYSTVGGGESNTSNGIYSTVGGGFNNTSSGSSSTVGGGYQNTSSAYYSTVGGGKSNTSSSISSTVGGGKSNTSSGSYSTVGGGYQNTSSGNSSTVGGGIGNTSSGYYSTVPGGFEAIASKYGELSHAAGSFLNAGDAQHSVLIARRTTTNATANQVLYLDASAARLTLPAKTTWTFEVKLSAYNDTDSVGAGWIYRGVIKRDGSDNTSLVGSLIEENWKDTAMNSASSSIVADDANEALEIRVTGLASKNIRWVAVVDISQVSYGTP